MAKHRKPSKIRQFITYWNTEDKPSAAKPSNVIKFRRHMICFTLGIALAIASTYLGETLIHLAPALPVLPSALQEVFDRIRDL